MTKGAMSWTVVLSAIGVLCLFAGFVEQNRERAAPERETLIQVKDPVQLFEARPGDTIFANFELRNVSGREVKVLGGTSNCGCTAVLNKFPIELGSGGTATMRVRVITGDGDPSGFFEKAVKLFVNQSGTVPLLEVKIHVLK